MFYDKAFLWLYLGILKSNHSTPWQCLLYLGILKTNHHSILWLYLGILKTNHSVLWLYLGILKTNHSVLLYWVSCINIKTLRCSRGAFSALRKSKLTCITIDKKRLRISLKVLEAVKERFPDTNYPQHDRWTMSKGKDICGRGNFFLQV